jgi:Cytochrome C biogenesis protein
MGHRTGGSGGHDAMVSLIATLLIAAGALLLTGLVLAPPTTVSAQGFDQEAREITKLLRCPVCQNISVADSPSELPGDMRALNGGGSWTSLPLQADIAAVTFDPLNAGVLLTVDTQGRVFRSEDRGFTWRNG